MNLNKDEIDTKALKDIFPDFTMLADINKQKKLVVKNEFNKSVK